MGPPETVKLKEIVTGISAQVDRESQTLQSQSTQQVAGLEPGPVLMTFKCFILGTVPHTPVQQICL